MLNKIYLLPIFFLIFLFITIPYVYPEDEADIDIDDLPQQLADHIGIDLFPSQILLSSLVIVGIALPLALMRAKGILILIVAFCTMSFLIAIAWLPYWIMLLVALLVAGLYATKIKGMM